MTSWFSQSGKFEISEGQAAALVSDAMQPSGAKTPPSAWQADPVAAPVSV